MKYTVSVIIILKNELGVVDTISGLNKQNYPMGFEIIVVDRSTITYPKITSNIPITWIKYNPNGKRFTIPEQRNLGVKSSSGGVIVFIDASCIPKENWLSEILNPIFQEGEVLVMGKTGSLGRTTLNDLHNVKLESKKYVAEAPTINIAISRKVFSIVGFFDEKLEYGSDMDFTWRAVEKGLRIRYQPSAYVEHNWGDGKQELKRAILYGKGRVRVLIKHFDKHWKNLFGVDIIVLLYPLLILLLPITIVYHYYPLIFLILVLKNIREPNPFGIVLKHIIFGFGVLIEVFSQILAIILNKKLENQIDV